uniref:HTH psq-type domain-containing protein n=1 Tax=Strongyloides papillosus TaxID=174720 RepID=A0A0N5C551_STREA
MQAVMTNMGQDNNTTVSNQTSLKEESVVKNFKNNSTCNEMGNKKLVDEDEPLDLSNKNNLISTMNVENVSNDIVVSDTIRLQEQLIQNGALSLLPYAFQSQVLNKSSTSTSSNKWSSPRGAANRRTYTQADLEAAVNDIRSGKLGTRRASVVYGIPRSTLRNKIYKLESTTANPADILIIGKKKKKCSDAEGKDKEDDKSPYKSLTEPEIHLSKLFNTNESVNVANGMIIKSPKNEEGCLPCVGEILGFNNLQRQSSVLSIGLHQKEENEKRILSRENSFNKIYEGNTSRNSSENGDNSNSDGLKKSRPKRGQYRKYDKDALDEAVKSVRRGEMSVHRAGSFFGVPHSTLEYKVKERNLLRIKKRQKSFEDYNVEEKESLLVKEKNNALSKNQQSSNVLTSLVTSWNMLSHNSENMLASKSSINE